ncbi:hypothetical protein [Bartonella pachyuromydis]|uniref:hypothetical protein n=1 Tax=Bartonella pachyuromydis TaxID=931097 RepID=UPI0031EEF671
MKEAGMQVRFFSEERRKLSIFIAIGCFLLLSEAIYDLVFANIAYSLTGKTTSVTTTYAIGYVAEIIVMILGAGFIDQFNKWRLFIATQILNIMVFALVMIVLSRDYIHIISLWGFAFFVDLIHHYSRLIFFLLRLFFLLKSKSFWLILLKRWPMALLILLALL